MHPRLGAFRAALFTGWIGLSVAGLVYARQKNIPLTAAIPIIAAFLMEYSFYLVPGFEPVREWLRGHLSRPLLATVIGISATLPYLVYSIPTGEFHWIAFSALCAIIAGVSFWYVVFRPSPAADVLFLVLLAAIVLSRSLTFIYTSSVVKSFSILGHLTLIHMGALVALELRRVEGIGFGFIPSQKEWITGVQYFFYFLPVGIPLAMWLGVVHFNFPRLLFWKALASFFGALWVIALSEEFFFRGLLQQWLMEWTRRPWLSLSAASLVYGASHLWFQHAFPNWKMAVIDSLLGCICGLAFRKAASIRSSMVTHALVITLWRTLFVS